MDFEHTFKIFVPSICACGEELPEGPLNEIIKEIQTQMSDWFGGYQNHPFNGGFNHEDGRNTQEPNCEIKSYATKEAYEAYFDDFTIYVADLANRLTQEVMLCEIDGKGYPYPALNLPNPDQCKCMGGKAIGQLPKPFPKTKRIKLISLQSALQNIKNIRDVRYFFCRILNYEHESIELATLDWPDSLQDLLAKNTLPEVIAGYNGFKIIHLQLSTKDLRKGHERKLIQRILKDDPTLRALFVVSNIEHDQWHLINIKDTPEAIKTKLHLRFFRIGEGQQVRTAAERLELIDIANLNPEVTAAELQDAHNQAFDVESVSQDFFNEISNWYFWALSQVEFPQDTVVEGEEEKHRATSLIRFLTRIIFCWFLKEKGLIPESLFNRKELEAMLVDLDDDHCTYHQGILQNLFFATLNQRMGKDSKTGEAYRAFAKDEGFVKNRSTYGVDTLYRYEEHFKDEAKALGYFAEVPFLNGGLFECLDRTDDDGKKLYLDGFSRNKKKRARIPNKLFFAPVQNNVGEYLSKVYGDSRRRNSTVRGLLNILHAYNFTVEENTPVDEEIALDPELLGKVFENLLASYNEETKTTARKQTGSFYTPRPIVEYMVDESLKAHLADKLTKLGRQEVNAIEQLDLLLGYTDEAPSFSEGETDALLEAIHACKILDPACGSGAFPIGMLQKLVHVVHKLDPENARWKQLQIKSAENIPDPSAKAAAIKAIERDFEENGDDYGRKLYLIENCLYGVDIQPIAIQISKLRFFISLICDQKNNRDKAKNHGIRPLPNLETKFVAANTLVGLPEMDQMALIDPRINQIEVEIELLYHRHFSIQRRDQKFAVQKKLNDLRKEMGHVLAESLGSSRKAEHIAKWDPFDFQASAGFFDPNWMFGRGLSKGFDIVIGNPPYIKIQNMSSSSPEFTKYLKSNYASANSGSFDLYVTFLERGLNLIKQDGESCFIVPHKFFNAGYGKGLRKLISENRNLRKVLHFDEIQLFKNVSIYTCIIFLDKKPKLEFEALKLSQEIYDEKNLSTLIFNKYPVDSWGADDWYIQPKELNSLMEKLMSHGNLSEFTTNIFQGPKAGADNVFILKEIKKGKLTSVFHSSAVDSEVEIENGILVKYLKSKYICRYFLDYSAGEYAIFPYANDGSLLTQEILEQNFPLAYKYLSSDKVKLILKAREKGRFKSSYWQYSRPQNMSIISARKLITPFNGFSCSFTLDDQNDFLFSAGVTGAYGIILKESAPFSYYYLLGVLNSKISMAIISVISTTLRGGYYSFENKYIKKLPIPIPPKAIEEKVTALVKKVIILKRSDRNDEQVGDIEDELEILINKTFDLTDEEIIQIKNIL